jgi:hemerythrin
VEFFKWKDSFCVGIEELDQQHRSFLECLNECHAQVSTGKRAGIDADLLKRLKTYAAEHFVVEEEMMRLFGYTGIGVQGQQHLYFTAQIAELETALARGSEPSARSVLTFLRDWFLEHVLSEDKKFAALVLVAKKDKGDTPLRR